MLLISSDEWQNRYGMTSTPFRMMNLFNLGDDKFGQHEYK